LPTWLRRIAIAALFTPFLPAQNRVAEWLESKVRAEAEAGAAKRKPAQADSIAIDRGSTSFLDQTAGADLASTALNLAPVSNVSRQREGSGGVSVSLFGIYTLATRQDPLIPEIYNRHEALRKVFFSLGREENGGSTQPAGTFLGVKYLLQNKRDATSIARDPVASKLLANILSRFAAAIASSTGGLLAILHASADKTRHPTPTALLVSFQSVADVEKAVAALPPEEKVKVDAIVEEYRKKLANAGDLKVVVNQLQRRPQLALDFQTTQRDATIDDDYRIQMIYDQAVSDRWAVTVNGSFDYVKSRSAEDMRGGRGAFEFRYKITEVRGYTLQTPMQLAISGEALRRKDSLDYRAQLRVVIPISGGINLPMSAGYGRQTNTLRRQEAGVFGKFALTFDFAKIVEALRSR